jgi:hypothetical protein
MDPLTGGSRRPGGAGTSRAEPAGRERPGFRTRPIALTLAALVVANALALLVADPPRDASGGPLASGHVEFATPEVAARSQRLARMQRAFIFLGFNTTVVAGVAFALLARRWEHQRRLRLGLPDDLDEALAVAPGRRPRAAVEYRPSEN